MSKHGTQAEMERLLQARDAMLQALQDAAVELWGNLDAAIAEEEARIAEMGPDYRISFNPKILKLVYAALRPDRDAREASGE